MRFVERQVQIVTTSDGTVNPALAADVMWKLPRVARSAAFMAIRGSGAFPGRRPGWAERIAEIRFAGTASHGSTMSLRYSLPTLVEAAPDLLGQSNLFRPPPPADATALDMLAFAVHEVANDNAESQAYDEHVLRLLASLGKAVDDLGPIVLPAWARDEEGTTLDNPIIERARGLQRRTPPPMPWRIVGELDMIRASTQEFGLLLADGTLLPGIYEGDAAELATLLRSEVVAAGLLVFRASGRPLRLEANTICAAGHEAPMWREFPPPQTVTAAVPSLRRRQTPQTGLGAMFGQWPGDEDDEVIAAELARIS